MSIVNVLSFKNITMIVLICLIYSAVVVVNSETNKNNVCRTNSDYNNKINNKNCWYNSDVDLTVPEIIQKYKYPMENYETITDDGYKRQLFRIPFGKFSPGNKYNKLQPVLIIHGLTTSPAPFVTAGNNSMGFILADEGYDVWLANSRGSTYGKGHTKYSTKDLEYWNFSFHEMGLYDVPNVLDFIYNVTSRNDTIVIGNSMGTNIQLAYASLLPEHVKKRVKLMVYLAPTAFLLDVRTPLGRVAPLWPELQELTKQFQVGELLSKDQFSAASLQICLTSEMQVVFCETVLMSLMGFDFKNFPPSNTEWSNAERCKFSSSKFKQQNEILPVILGHHPAGTSPKTLVHLAQNLQTKRFCQFDYGVDRNKEIYQLEKPPDYNLSQITVPGLLMYAVNDYFSSKKGVFTLYNALPKGNNIIYEIKDRMYSHMDFFYARNSVTQVTNYMLYVMQKYKTTLP